MGWKLTFDLVYYELTIMPYHVQDDRLEANSLQFPSMRLLCSKQLNFTDHKQLNACLVSSCRLKFYGT